MFYSANCEVLLFAVSLANTVCTFSSFVLLIRVRKIRHLAVVVVESA
jgi:hypothetical protein